MEQLLSSAQLFKKISLLLGVIFFVAQCSPEKAPVSNLVSFPLLWLDSHSLLVSKGNAISIIKFDKNQRQLSNKQIYRPDTPKAIISGVCYSFQKWVVNHTIKTETLLSTTMSTGKYIELTVSNFNAKDSQISLKQTRSWPKRSFQTNPFTCKIGKWHFDSYKNISINGKNYRLLPFDGAQANSWVFDSAVSDKAYYAKSGSEYYILNYHNNTWQVIKLPHNTGPSKTATLSVRRDTATGHYLVFRSPCYAGDCPSYAGWWLDTNLNVINTLQLPTTNLLEVEEGIRCFSCGCSCYTHQKTYIHKGKVYAHLWGWPLPEKRRGIHVVRNNKNGQPYWHQLISDQISSPVRFNPKNCLVAYNRKNDSNGEIVIKNICSIKL